MQSKSIQNHIMYKAEFQQIIINLKYNYRHFDYSALDNYIHTNTPFIDEKRYSFDLPQYLIMYQYNNKYQWMVL